MRQKNGERGSQNMYLCQSTMFFILILLVNRNIKIKHYEVTLLVSAYHFFLKIESFHSLKLRVLSVVNFLANFVPQTKLLPLHQNMPYTLWTMTFSSKVSTKDFLCYKSRCKKWKFLNKQLWTFPAISKLRGEE